MTTIKDVAQHAHVSIGTVSRVLASNPTVSSELRARVLSSIEHLRFTPNAIAQGLRRNRNAVIGLVVPDITNPFFAELAKFVEGMASQIGYSVFLANTNDDPAVERIQLDTLLSQSPTGIIIVPTTNLSTIAWPETVSTVVVDRAIPGHQVISVDHVAGARMAAEHLLDLGHKRLAYISGPASSDVAMLRLEGFHSALSFKNLSTTPAILGGNFDYQTGEMIGNQLLSQPFHQRPTAIATANDQQAIGVMRAAADLGMKVPADLSVVGFDNIPLASLVTPRLTTVAQPLEEIARQAVASIIDESDIGHLPRRVAPTLKIRESTTALEG
jgi:LacI family transcriptional regulator